jgi:putative ubiquitin-RnfH superfamily antitoxin RatB of RatAB toxin-antitoxin module
MRVHVAYVAPGTQLLVDIDLPAGATVDDALRAAGVEQHVGGVPDAEALAVFGRRVSGATALRDGDRVEVTRALLCVPKTVRRERALRKAAGAKGDPGSTIRPLPRKA